MPERGRNGIDPLLGDAYYDVRNVARTLSLSQKLRLRLTNTLRRRYRERIAINGHSVITDGRTIFEVLRSFTQDESSGT